MLKQEDVKERKEGRKQSQKRNKNLTFAAKWTEFNIIMLHEISQTQTNTMKFNSTQAVMTGC